MSDHNKPNVLLNDGIRRMRDNIATDAQIADSASRVLEHLHAENAKVVPHPAAQATSGIQLSQTTLMLLVGGVLLFMLGGKRGR